MSLDLVRPPTGLAPLGLGKIDQMLQGAVHLAVAPQESLRPRTQPIRIVQAVQSVQGAALDLLQVSVQLVLRHRFGLWSSRRGHPALPNEKAPAPSGTGASFPRYHPGSPSSFDPSTSLRAQDSGPLCAVLRPSTAFHACRREAPLSPLPAFRRAGLRTAPYG